MFSTTWKSDKKIVLWLQVMKTEFVPKLVATATVCCAIYLVLAVSDKLLTVKTLASVGYFESMVRLYLILVL